MRQGVQRCPESKEILEVRGTDARRPHADTVRKSALPQVGRDGDLRGSRSCAEHREVTASNANCVNAETGGWGR
jgi:hypothetical protein